MLIRVLLLVWIIHEAAGQCQFPDALLGSWTSSNYGLLTFSNTTPQFTMNEFGVLPSTSSTEFDCLLIDGTQYIVKSNATYVAFGGALTVYPYICLDLRETNAYSYYYYQNSAVEDTFNSQRAVGIDIAITVNSSSQVCNASLVDTAEFHTMVKVGSLIASVLDPNRARCSVGPDLGTNYLQSILSDRLGPKRSYMTEKNDDWDVKQQLKYIYLTSGFETEAVTQCPDSLLMSATYIYTDATGTYCSGVNTTLVDSCSSSLNASGSSILFNETLVTDVACSAKNPAYSANGLLGCVTKIDDATNSQYYVSLYNYDTTVSEPTTYRYTCAAVTSDQNGTVFISMLPKDCTAGQNSTILPTGGALMEFTTFDTCVPVSVDSQYDWTWLIILCVVLFVLLILILVAILICLYIKKKEREKAREKKILITEEHPLAEVSMPLDAPSSMEPMTDTAFLEMRDEVYRTPRDRKKEKAMKNPMSETSMILDFKSPRWTNSKGPKPIVSDDPFSETSNGEIVPISPSGSKAHRSMLNYKQRSYSTAFLESNHNTVIHGDLIRRASERALNKAYDDRSRPATERSRTDLMRRASERSLNKSYDEKSRPATQRSGTELLRGASMRALNKENETTSRPGTQRSGFFQATRDRAPSRKSGITPTPKSGRTSSRRSKVAAVPSPQQNSEITQGIVPSNTNKTPSVAPSVKSSKSAKGKPVPSSRTKTNKRISRTQGVVSIKLGRSTTSTKLGNVTNRPNPSSRGNIKRSKTTIEPTLPTIAKAKEGERIEASAMNEFLAAEAGSTAGVSQTDQPRKSAPKRKSILKKTSVYFPLEDISTEEQRFPTIPSTSDNTYESDNMNMIHKNNDVTGDATHDISDDRASPPSARDSFLDIKAKEYMSKNSKTPVPSKTPWH